MLVPAMSSSAEESETVTDAELLAIREQVLGLPAQQQDLLMRLLRLPPQQQNAFSRGPQEASKRFREALSLVNPLNIYR